MVEKITIEMIGENQKSIVEAEIDLELTFL